MQEHSRKPRKRTSWYFTMILSLAVLTQVICLNGCSEDGCRSIGGNALSEPEISSLIESSLYEQLSERSTTDQRFQSILEQADQYPEELLLLALKNDETISFVAEYPENREPSVQTATLTLDTPEGIPHLLQWDQRWGYHTYGSGIMGLTGCGPTCMSMVVTGLTGRTDVTPLTVSEYCEQQGWYVDGIGTSWDLMRDGAEHFGLDWQELPLYENSIIQALSSGSYIIASVMEGDFTDCGHFIVISGWSDSGFMVLDPNSKRNSRHWSYDELSGQINNLWSFTAA